MRLKLSHIFILFLISLASIIIEVNISRLFAFTLSYHFVFIIMAFALLGLGLGEIFYYKNKKVKHRVHLFYVMLPFSFFSSYFLLIGLNNIDIFLGPSISLLMNAVLTMIPFINIGIVKADIFQKEKFNVSWFYGIDLAGAALGALLTIIILNKFGLQKSFLFGFIALGISNLALPFIIENKNKVKLRRVVIQVSLLAILAWLGFFMVKLNPKISNDESKDMLRLMKNPMLRSTILDSDWNSFGKTDLIKFTDADDKTKILMFIDGAAGTELISISSLENDSSELIEQMASFPATFELDFLNINQRDTCLIIGPGGGIDIAAAYFMDFKVIEAVEVNPSFVRLMKEYNPSTFSTKDNIKVFALEGRNFVGRSKDKYDVIMLTIPVTKGGRGVDFYSLTENYLFTTEAIRDYLNALTTEGRIIFTMHNRMEVYRMLANYLELMNASGIDSGSAMKNVVIYSKGMNSVLVIKKTPFEMGEIEVQHAFSHQFGFDKDLLFFPYIKQVKIDTILSNNANFKWFMFDKLLYGISDNEFDYQEISRASLHNLNPVHDNSPYFFNYEIGIPESLIPYFILSIIILGWILYETRNGWNLTKILTKEEIKKFKLLLYLVFILEISYFFSQAYIFQYLNLQLENPTQSFSILLFTFLIGNAIGSFYASSLTIDLIKKLSIFCLIIVSCLIILKLLIFPILLLHQISKIMVVIILIIPSIFIGIPFPILLKEATNYPKENSLPLLLGVSSVVSVSASILVIIISLLWSYTYVFWISITIYLTVATFSYWYKGFSISATNN